MTKLKMWQSDWDEAEKEWEARAKEAAKKFPLKGLNKMPKMVGITKETAKNLKWKALKWMVLKDHKREILKGFLKHPFRYGLSLMRSLINKKSYTRDGDFFYYGINSEEEFKKLLKTPNTVFVVGFSYCHKPFECPSGRFTPDCIHDPENPVCKQCFIGKAMHALPEKNTVPLVIPTVHYIGGKIFEIVHSNPGKEVLFLITACEMTLQMFGDWGNMAAIKGIGVRLDGRICNTMRAFELSENGIKPGLTVVLDPTKRRILDLLNLKNAVDNDR